MPALCSSDAAWLVCALLVAALLLLLLGALLTAAERDKAEYDLYRLRVRLLRAGLGEWEGNKFSLVSPFTNRHFELLRMGRDARIKADQAKKEETKL
jgi:hypothetical protein